MRKTIKKAGRKSTARLSNVFSKPQNLPALKRKFDWNGACNAIAARRELLLLDLIILAYLPRCVNRFFMPTSKNFQKNFHFSYTSSFLLHSNFRRIWSPTNYLLLP